MARHERPREHEAEDGRSIRGRPQPQTDRLAGRERALEDGPAVGERLEPHGGALRRVVREREPDVLPRREADREALLGPAIGAARRRLGIVEADLGTIAKRLGRARRRRGGSRGRDGIGGERRDGQSACAAARRRRRPPRGHRGRQKEDERDVGRRASASPSGAKRGSRAGPRPPPRRSRGCRGRAGPTTTRTPRPPGTRRSARKPTSPVSASACRYALPGLSRHPASERPSSASRFGQLPAEGSEAGALDRMARRRARSRSARGPAGSRRGTRADARVEELRHAGPVLPRAAERYSAATIATSAAAIADRRDAPPGRDRAREEQPSRPIAARANPLREPERASPAARTGSAVAAARGAGRSRSPRGPPRGPRRTRTGSRERSDRPRPREPPGVLPVAVGLPAEDAEPLGRRRRRRSTRRRRARRAGRARAPAPARAREEEEARRPRRARRTRARSSGSRPRPAGPPR